jgi:hypothetical protein
MPLNLHDKSLYVLDRHGLLFLGDVGGQLGPRFSDRVAFAIVPANRSIKKHVQVVRWLTCGAKWRPRQLWRYERGNTALSCQNGCNQFKE